MLIANNHRLVKCLANELIVKDIKCRKSIVESDWRQLCRWRTATLQLRGAAKDMRLASATKNSRQFIEYVRNEIETPLNLKNQN